MFAAAAAAEAEAADLLTSKRLIPKAGVKPEPVKVEVKKEAVKPAEAKKEIAPSKAKPGRAKRPPAFDPNAPFDDDADPLDSFMVGLTTEMTVTIITFSFT